LFLEIRKEEGIWIHILLIMLSALFARSFAQSATKYMPRVLSAQQLADYQRDGYLRLRNILPPDFKRTLPQNVQEMEQLPEIPGKWMKYFELDRVNQKRLLCRIENFVSYYKGIADVVNGLLKDISSDCLGEDAVVYKEKINFKFPKSNGFRAHQDQPAFVSFGLNKLLTIVLPIDSNTKASGGLEFVPGGHITHKIMPTNSDGSLRTDIEAKMNWVPVDADLGDILVVDSYVPHRSDVNTTNFTRRNIYITYNPASQGNFREKYYELKRASFPPEVERDPNKDYSEGAKVFNVANPIQ
jgi:hypothetical protein